MLQHENEQLRAEIDIMNRRLDAAIEVMNDVTARDDNFYRVIMGAERVSTANGTRDLTTKTAIIILITFPMQN